MDRNIYNILNDADFSGDEAMLNQEDKLVFDEMERKRIKDSLYKKIKAKRNSKKAKVAGFVAAAVCLVAISNVSVRNVVWAAVNEMASKFDISKNTSTDFVIELDQEYSHNGVSIKLEEAYRDRREIRLVYSMNFKNGVPESVKAIEIPSNGGNILVGEDMPKKEYNLYENNGIRGCNIYINGKDIKSSNLYINENILSVISKELLMEKNKIQKEIVINLNNLEVKDLNISIRYDEIKEDNGNILEGPWEIDYTVTSNGMEEEVKKALLDSEYKFTGRNGEITSIESYAYTNTGLKIYGTDYNLKDYTGDVNPETWSNIRLQGTDNLGKDIIMYRRYPNYGEEFKAGRKARTEYSLYDGPEGLFNDRSTFDEGVTSVTLRIYEEKLTVFEDGSFAYDWLPAGEEFTINLE